MHDRPITMRAISLWQPWASLVACGAKRYETRSWSTPYRGPIAIHAAKKWSAELEAVARSEPFAAALGIDSTTTLSLGSPVRLPLGAIIAVATLARVERITIDNTHGLSDAEREFGDYTPGRFRWLLEDVRPLSEPFPCRGALGIFDVPFEGEGGAK